MSRLHQDPVDLALNDDGSIVVSDRGDLVWTTGAAAVRQQLLIALRSVRGEYILDPSLGVPYFEILGSKFDANRIRDLVRKQIESIDAVVSVTRLAVSLGVDRRVVVDFAVQTAFGVIGLEALL